jgi:hypothetical protein
MASRLDRCTGHPFDRDTADAAEAIFASLIDKALRAVERVVVQSWHEFLELRPGDKTGALAAALLDASEESVRLVKSANARVAEALLAGTRHACGMRKLGFACNFRSSPNGTELMHPTGLNVPAGREPYRGRLAARTAPP